MCVNLVGTSQVSDSQIKISMKEIILYLICSAQSQRALISGVLGGEISVAEPPQHFNSLRASVSMHVAPMLARYSIPLFILFLKIYISM